VLGVLGWTFAYEAAYAGGLIGEAGVREAPRWPGTSVLAVCAVMGLAGIAIAWVSMLDSVLIYENAARRLASMWSFAMLPGLAAAIVLAYWYTPDPYYFPNLRRFAEGGPVSFGEMAAVIVVALASTVLARIRPAPGLWLCSISLWFSALVMLSVRGGH
jgi:hypothetical protein